MTNEELMIILQRPSFKSLRERLEYAQKLLGDTVSNFFFTVYIEEWQEYLIYNDVNLKQPLDSKIEEFQKALVKELHEHLIQNTDSSQITNPVAYDILYNPESMDQETINHLYGLAEIFYDEYDNEIDI